MEEIYACTICFPLFQLSILFKINYFQVEHVFCSIGVNVSGCIELEMARIRLQMK